MNIQSKKKLVKGAVLFALTDTLAAHSLGGFKIIIGFSLRKCRICLSTGDQMAEKVLHNYYVFSLSACPVFMHIYIVKYTYSWPCDVHTHTHTHCNCHFKVHCSFPCDNIGLVSLILLGRELCRHCLILSLVLFGPALYSIFKI